MVEALPGRHRLPPAASHQPPTCCAPMNTLQRLYITREDLRPTHLATDPDSPTARPLT